MTRRSEGETTTEWVQEVMVAAGVLVTTPAFNVARKIPDSSSWPDYRQEHWRATLQIVRELDSEARLALGSADPLASTHYWGRTDFRAVADGHAPPRGGRAHPGPDHRRSRRHQSIPGGLRRRAHRPRQNPDRGGSHRPRLVAGP